MDSEKEKMLALIGEYSTTIVPSINLHSHLHGSSDSNSYIYPSNNNVHSYPNSNNNIHMFPHSNGSIQTVNIPPHFSGFQAGTNMSCASSTSLTSVPGKMFKPPDSDTSTDLLNLCRICQLPGDDSDILFSPCRCAGSLKYVHYSCLLKWIHISTRKTKRPPMCELCQFEYVRHKRFKFHDWHLPHISTRDKCLHAIFILTLVVMVTCAIATVLCFLSDSGQISQTKSHLSLEEIITLICGVLFFVSFFLAMTVEIKARHTVYSLFLKFILQNTEWQIEHYDKSRDPDCPRPYIHNV